MITVSKYKILFWPVFFLFLMVCTFTCTSKKEYAGVYRTEEADLQKRSELGLREDGEGYWRMGDNEESFSWSPKGDEIRLHTRKGGVIIAKIQGNTLRITLSGGKKLSFVKIK